MVAAGPVLRRRRFPPLLFHYLVTVTFEWSSLTIATPFGMSVLAAARRLDPKAPAQATLGLLDQLDENIGTEKIPHDDLREIAAKLKSLKASSIDETVKVRIKQTQKSLEHHYWQDLVFLGGFSSVKDEFQKVLDTECKGFRLADAIDRDDLQSTSLHEKNPRRVCFLEAPGAPSAAQLLRIVLAAPFLSQLPSASTFPLPFVCCSSAGDEVELALVARDDFVSLVKKRNRELLSLAAAGNEMAAAASGPSVVCEDDGGDVASGGGGFAFDDSDEDDAGATATAAAAAPASEAVATATPASVFSFDKLCQSAVFPEELSTDDSEGEDDSEGDLLLEWAHERDKFNAYAATRSSRAADHRDAHRDAADSDAALCELYCALAGGNWAALLATRWWPAVGAIQVMLPSARLSRLVAEHEEHSAATATAGPARGAQRQLELVFLPRLLEPDSEHGDAAELFDDDGNEWLRKKSIEVRSRATCG